MAETFADFSEDFDQQEPDTESIEAVFQSERADTAHAVQYEPYA